MLPPICDVFQTNLPDLLSVVCFFLRVACKKKKCFPTFHFMHCEFSPSTFLTPYGSQLTPVRAQNPSFLSPVRVLSSHINLIPIPLQSLQVCTRYKPPLEYSFGTIFPCCEVSMRAFFVLLTTHYHPTSTLLSSDLALKSTLWVFSPV